MKQLYRNRFLLPMLLVCVMLFPGCLTSRGVMYLGKERVDDYLAKEKRPASAKGKKKEVESVIERSRLLLRKVPDGNRIMGGFCTKKYIREQFQELIDVAPKCRKKLKLYQGSSNVNNIVFWSLLGSSIGLGVALGVSVAATPPQEGNTRLVLALVFGSLTVATAIVNTTVPFNEWQHEARVKMGRIDNYMWTLRKRVQIEVCNARNRDVAFDRMDMITRDFRLLCTAPEQDNGIYRIPTRASKKK